MSPIHGISLELYAELGADVTDHVNDQEACARIVEGRGIKRPDWEAAKTGWTARMQDPALMGSVAMRYMPLYQAALARKKGTADVSFEDYVAISGARKALGPERANAHYQIDDAAWTSMAMTWNTQRIPQDPMRYGMFGSMVEQEAMRLQQGGAPRPVQITRSTGGTTQAGAGPLAPAGPPQPLNAQQVENQMMAQAVNQQVAATMAAAQAQSAAAYGNASANMGFMGKGMLGAMGYGAIAQGVGPGMAVLVRWPDGQQYPATVAQVGGGQVCVAFGDGRQMWVPENAVSRRQ